MNQITLDEATLAGSNLTPPLEGPGYVARSNHTHCTWKDVHVDFIEPTDLTKSITTFQVILLNFLQFSDPLMWTASYNNYEIFRINARAIIIKEQLLLVIINIMSISRVQMIR